MQSAYYMNGWRLIEELAKDFPDFIPVQNLIFQKKYQRKNYIAAYNKAQGLCEKAKHFYPIRTSYVKLLKSLGYEKEFEKEKSKLEDEEFHFYMEQKMSGKAEEKPGAAAEHIEKVQERLKIPEVDQAKIYTLISRCRDLIQQGNIEEAKKLYNDIRQRFYKLEMSTKEKDALKNTIRDLYDSINLAVIG